MGRGMNLSEFKAALASDATIENENLKKELEDLKKSSSEKIKDLEEELEKNKKHVKALSNRCYVLTQGMLCINCNIGYPTCKHGLTSEDEIEVAKFIRKNNLPSDSVDTYEKAMEFLQKRRTKKEKQNGKNQ